MKHTLLYRESYPMLQCELEAGEEMVAEADAVVVMSESILLQDYNNMAAMRAFSKKLQHECFFAQRIVADGKPGKVLLAQAFPGTVLQAALDGHILVRKECFLAVTGAPEISFELLKFREKGNVEDRFSAISIQGDGDVFLGGYGVVHTIELAYDEPVKIDYNHLVAWEAHLNYTFPYRDDERNEYGENRLCAFSGQGRIWIQSRNLSGFKRSLDELK